MNFKQKLQAGKFVLTMEMEPPFGTDCTMFKEKALKLKGNIDAIVVTDQQSAMLKANSMVACYLLNQWGLEPVLQVACRDRNRIALQSDIISASILGIENALILTGDYITLGDHPEAKPVFDLDSVQLLQVANSLNNGIAMNEKELEGPTNLFLGAVVNPGSVPVEPQILKLENKVEAGAQFIITQAVYDPQSFEKFMHSVEHLNVPIIVGLLLLKSVKMCNYLNKSVAGVEVPQQLMDRLAKLSKVDDRKKESIDIGIELAESFKPLCQGIHFMPLGWDKQALEIIQQSGFNKTLNIAE
jgi:methylenetetrahydrofolate reductase (NADPH)